MNRRNFFKAAGAVMLGGLVGAQVKDAGALTYEWDISDQLVEMTPAIQEWQRKQAELERQAIAAFERYWESVEAEHARAVAAQVRREFERVLAGEGEPYRV